MRMDSLGKTGGMIAAGLLVAALWSGAPLQPAEAQSGAAPGPGAAPKGSDQPARERAWTADARLLARGRYLVAIMDCSGCHTPSALLGKPDGTRYLGGSEVGFQLPGVGVVYPKNLTPDPETGLGQWSVDEIIRAVRQGKGRDGRTLVPIMPWPSYAALTDTDARAVAVYLKSLPRIRNTVPRDTKEGEKPTAAYLTVVMPN